MCSCGIGASAHTQSSQTPECRNRPSRLTGGPYQVDFWSLVEGGNREETGGMSMEDMALHIRSDNDYILTSHYLESNVKMAAV